MRIEIGPQGFDLWLSARDTEAWASRPGEVWPCSELAGRRVYVCFDSNGLCNLAVDGKDWDGDSNELSALVSDRVESKLNKEYPCYFVAVGQFREGS